MSGLVCTVVHSRCCRWHCAGTLHNGAARVSEGSEGTGVWHDLAAILIGSWLEFYSVQAADHDVCNMDANY